ncbi:MAG: OsmC family protein [Cyanobacteria bacterium SZAS TMP-1]|nr:OsmC family protein [Cyanobacteria bacterium SZAS TMP-1]
MSKVVVNSQQETKLQQVITAGTHDWVCDATKDEGGSGVNPDPHQYLLGALGACTAMTLQIYAQRQGWNLKNVNVKLSEERVDDPDNLSGHMSRITRDIEVEGDLNEEHLQKLKTIADKCPIHRLLVGHKVVMTSLSVLNKKTEAACHVD